MECSNQNPSDQQQMHTQLDSKSLFQPQESCSLVSDSNPATQIQIQSIKQKKKNPKFKKSNFYGIRTLYNEIEQKGYKKNTLKTVKAISQG